jgi:hypothetical protein
MEAMTRRRVLCGLLLASAVLACFAGWLVMASGPRITRERMEQVTRGMSRDEVIRTVGGPPRKHPWPPLDVCDYWACDDTDLLVRFDRAGTAVHVEIMHADDMFFMPRLTLTQRIRRWLGL